MAVPGLQAELRLLSDSSDAGEELVHIMLIYLNVSIVVMLLFGIFMCRMRCKADNGHKVGIFAATHWHIAARGPLSLGMLMVVVLPSFALVVSVVFGSILAAAEGWSLTLGIEYVLSNVLGLQNPLTDIVPGNTMGRLVDIFMSIWSMLLVVTAMGLAANMSLMISLTRIMPQTTLGFICWLLVYIPVILLSLSVVTGGVMAAIEGWSFEIGFFYMAGAVAGLGNPIVDEAPESGIACFFEIMCISLELCLGGAVIGIIGAHPVTAHLVSLIEGTEEHPAAQGAAEETSEVTELRSKVASLEAEVLELEMRHVGTDA